MHTTTIPPLPKDSDTLVQDALPPGLPSACGARRPRCAVLLQVAAAFCLAVTSTAQQVNSAPLVQKSKAGNYYSAQRPHLPPLPFSPFPEGQGLSCGRAAVPLR